MATERLSGELFDLTITSLNNPYGYEKIFYSLLHGIKTPIQKYIDELDMIGKITQDDKSKKRSIRLQFLNATRKDPDIDTTTTFSTLCSDPPEKHLCDAATEHFFDEYFQDIMCYLNGGNPFEDNDSHFDTNQLIITIAGGNIITIFAKLFVNLMTYMIAKQHNPSTLTSEECLSWFNLNFYEKKITTKKIDYNFDILKYIFHTFFPNSLCPSEWQGFLLSKYSDFDYNLLPNKTKEETSKEEIKGILDLVRNANLDQPQGFVLMRVKSNLLYNNPDETKIIDEKGNYKKTLIQNCFNLRLDDPNATIRKLTFIPQLMSGPLVNDYLGQFKPSSPKSNEDYYDKCKDALDYLLLKKKSISNETSVNINTVIKVFRNGYNKTFERVQSIQLDPITTTKTTTELFSQALDPNILDLDAIMKYLHCVTSQLNVFIGLYEQQKLAVSKFDRYSANMTDSTMSVISNFANLCDITNHSTYGDQLLMLSGYLLKVFLNFPSFHTEEILDQLITDNITDEFRRDQNSDEYFRDTWGIELRPIKRREFNKSSKPRETKPEISLLQSKVALVPGKITYKKDSNCDIDNIRKSLNEVANDLRDELKSDYPFPDGSILTINRIETDNVFPDSQRVIRKSLKGPDYSIDTLEESFNKLDINADAKIKEKDTDEDNITNIEAELGGTKNTVSPVSSSKRSVLGDNINQPNKCNACRAVTSDISDTCQNGGSNFSSHIFKTTDSETQQILRRLLEKNDGISNKSKGGRKKTLKKRTSFRHKKKSKKYIRKRVKRTRRYKKNKRNKKSRSYKKL